MNVQVTMHFNPWANLDVAAGYVSGLHAAVFDAGAACLQGVRPVIGDIRNNDGAGLALGQPTGDAGQEAKKFFDLLILPGGEEERADVPGVELAAAIHGVIGLRKESKMNGARQALGNPRDDAGGAVAVETAAKKQQRPRSQRLVENRRQR